MKTSNKWCSIDNDVLLLFVLLLRVRFH